MVMKDAKSREERESEKVEKRKGREREEISREERESEKVD